MTPRDPRDRSAPATDFRWFVSRDLKFCTNILHILQFKGITVFSWIADILEVRVIEISYVTVFVYFPLLLADLLWFKLRARRLCFAQGSNAPNHRSRGLTPQHTLSARNSSTEWGLAPSHRFAPSDVYVEDNLERVCESRLDNRPGARPVLRPS
ncbi:hypothetical protein CRG98_043704 [Punica granatum]|uniref:Uncharacterized protein n=1 Tax=Punica granatum TaxID=22663 RepID=A0A2I0HW28_PUNGR|nr:hypothetical protein CRG98_043704 [Punica granatum]